MKRREFIYKTGALATVSSVSSTEALANYTHHEESRIMNEIKPTQAQQAWMDLKFGMFIHFGINTYYDVEWSDGDLDPKAFNPSEMDTDRWCATAKKAGMKYLVITTKHHDGFCLWP